jgi:hypothetical protein
MKKYVFEESQRKFSEGLNNDWESFVESVSVSGQFKYVACVLGGTKEAYATLYTKSSSTLSVITFDSGILFTDTSKNNIVIKRKHFVGWKSFKKGKEDLFEAHYKDMYFLISKIVPNTEK